MLHELECLRGRCDRSIALTHRPPRLRACRLKRAPSRPPSPCHRRATPADESRPIDHHFTRHVNSRPVALGQAVTLLFREAIRTGVPLRQTPRRHICSSRIDPLAATRLQAGPQHSLCTAAWLARRRWARTKRRPALVSRDASQLARVMAALAMAAPSYGAHRPSSSNPPSSSAALQQHMAAPRPSSAQAYYAPLPSPPVHRSRSASPSVRPPTLPHSISLPSVRAQSPAPVPSPACDPQALAAACVARDSSDELTNLQPALCAAAGRAARPTAGLFSSAARRRLSYAIRRARRI